MRRLGLGPDRLERFLFLLKLCRHFDQRMVALDGQGKLPGAFHSSLGQEGVYVGVASALGPRDALFPTPRDVAAQVAKGIDLPRVMAQFWGRIHGYTRGRDADGQFGDWSGARTFAAVPPPAMASAVACGAALAYQILGDDRVAMAICDEAATSNGRWHEGLAISASQRLPVVWVVASERGASSSRDEIDPPSPVVVQRAATSGVSGVQVEAGAVLDVYEAASGSVERARRGEGPTLIECAPPAEGEAAASALPDPQDPVTRFERLLLQLGVTDDARIAELDQRVRSEFDRGFAFAQGSPLPPAGDVTRGLWVEDGYWHEEPMRDGADA
jgi:pyruvate dehydrogenase E1 component alpha subunit